MQLASFHLVLSLVEAKERFQQVNVRWNVCISANNTHRVNYKADEYCYVLSVASVSRPITQQYEQHRRQLNES